MMQDRASTATLQRDSTGPRILTVVSGKGGVGKTLICSSIAACIASGGSKVLLVDLDFENQGLTALVSSHFEVPDACSSWVSQVTESESLSDLRILSLRDGILFLPAPSLGKGKEAFRSGTIAEHFLFVLDQLRERMSGSVDVIILDCHGSADPVTRTAVQLSDQTLLITEADPISFGGSLEWLKEMVQQINAPLSSDKLTIIANRVLPRFRAQGLRSVIRDTFSDTIALSDLKSESLVCIPAESSIATVFGKVPFAYEIAHGTVFRAKIDLLVYNVFSALKSTDLVPQRARRRFERRWKKAIIQRLIDTREAFIKRHFFIGGVSLAILLSLTVAELTVRQYLLDSEYTTPFLIQMSAALQNPSFLAGTVSPSGAAMVILLTALYAYFASIWIFVFLEFYYRARIAIGLVRASTGYVRSFGALSAIGNSVVAFWSLPIAFLLTVGSTIFVISTIAVLIIGGN